MQRDAFETTPGFLFARCIRHASSAFEPMRATKARHVTAFTEATGREGNASGWRRGEGRTPLSPEPPFVCPRCCFCTPRRLAVTQKFLTKSLSSLLHPWFRHHRKQLVIQVTCLPPTHRSAHWDHGLRRPYAFKNGEMHQDFSVGNSVNLP